MLVDQAKAQCAMPECPGVADPTIEWIAQLVAATKSTADMLDGTQAAVVAVPAGLPPDPHTC